MLITQLEGIFPLLLRRCRQNSVQIQGMVAAELLVRIVEPVPECEKLHPYTFSMMKLFAFRDRLDDSDKESGRYHALDLYTILATTTEGEWEYALQLRDQYKNDPLAIEAGHLVSEYFSAPERLGMIRLRESHYYRSELQIEKFMSVLRELFPVGAEPFSQES